MQKSILGDLKIEPKKILELTPHPQNARTHSKHQIRQIAESIRTFGFTNPVLIDSKCRIVAGHGRVAAAKLLGICEVPTIRLDQLTEEQVRAYIIAENKLAENAGWDRATLAIELEYLMRLENIDFDVTVTGFEVPEIDLILEDGKEKPLPEDDLPQMAADQVVITQPGDLWILGKHRILCELS